MANTKYQQRIINIAASKAVPEPDYGTLQNGQVVWIVHGVAACWPQMVKCKIVSYTNAPETPYIWGFSEFRRSKGYRTMGIKLAEHRANTIKHDSNSIHEVFLTADDAYEFLRACLDD